jgi:hypothetical protein
LFIALFQVPGLIRAKYWKELIAFSILLFIGFGLSLFMALGFDLPNISTLIGQLFKSIFHMSG